jgi:cob(I)alamin adenosyltransferase
MGSTGLAARTRPVDITVAGQRRNLTGLRTNRAHPTLHGPPPIGRTCSVERIGRVGVGPQLARVLAGMTDDAATTTPGDSTGTPTDALTEDPRPDGLRSAPSLVLVNTGNGKGKSSAAFGVMLRSIAAGWKVAVCQFIKSGAWKVGEEQVGRQLGVDWHSFGDGFTWDSDDLGHDIGLARTGWARAKALIEAGDHRLVVLDELTYLCSWGWIDESDVVATIENRPDHVNVIITGRDAPAALIEIADTVTEMIEIKHSYRQGIRAKRGIDY